MNFIKKTAFLSCLLMLVMSANAQAGKQGINFFYGVGLTAISSDEKAIEYDTAGGGELIVGVEEDGWAFEYSGFRTAEANTNITTTSTYTTEITQTSLAYRTIESGKMYYKIKMGAMTANIDYSDTTLPVITTGNFFGLGLGMRTQRDARMELEYALYSSNDIGNTHMITLRYLFGGAPYEGSGSF